MAKQNTVIVLEKEEVCAALQDYIKKHYGEEVDVLTKDVYTMGYNGTKEVLDTIDIIVEEEDIEDVEDEDEVPERSSETLPRSMGYHHTAKSSGADIAFDALSNPGTTRPRAG